MTKTPTCHSQARWAVLILYGRDCRPVASESTKLVSTMGGRAADGDPKLEYGVNFRANCYYWYRDSRWIIAGSDPSHIKVVIIRIGSRPRPTGQVR